MNIKIIKIEKHEFINLHPTNKRMIHNNLLFYKMLDENGNVLGIRKAVKTETGIMSLQVVIMQKYIRNAKYIIDSNIKYYLDRGTFEIFQPTERVKELLEIKPKFTFTKNKDSWEIIKIKEELNGINRN